MGSWDGEDSWQGNSWQTGQHSGWLTRQSHICVQINQEKQLGIKTDLANPELQHGVK